MKRESWGAESIKKGTNLFDDLKDICPFEMWAFLVNLWNAFGNKNTKYEQISTYLKVVDCLQAMGNEDNNGEIIQQR